MAKASLIISIIVLLGTAYLGYLTKLEVEKKNAALKSETELYHVTDKHWKDTQAELKKTQDTLVAANKTIDDQKAQIEGLDKDIANLKMEIEGDKMRIADLEMKVTERDMQIAKITEELKHPIQSDSPEMMAVKKQIEDLNKEVAEGKQVQATLTQQNKGLTENLAAANGKIKHYETPILQAGMSGHVVNVNPGWNFVVIDMGDRQGVSVNSPLFVMRGGQMIARLKITSVEPRTSIADIIPGSMAKGNVVQSGDHVVFAGVRGITPIPGSGGPPPTPDISLPSGANASPAPALPAR